jgi:hypothetical protein
VLVVPSAKFQFQVVGLPVDVSVNWTVWPVTGEAGLWVNEAVSELAGAMVTVRLVVFWADPFMTVKLTVYVPADVNVWLGLCTTLAAPSPKFHCQRVGIPTELSVN